MTLGQKLRQTRLSKGLSQSPVSYTHLDVYKRQETYLSPRKCKFFVRSAKNLRAVEVQLLNQKSVSFFDYRVRKNIRAKRIVMTQVPALTSLILPVKILMKT